MTGFVLHSAETAARGPFRTCHPDSEHGRRKLLWTPFCTPPNPMSSCLQRHDVTRGALALSEAGHCPELPVRACSAPRLCWVTTFVGVARRLRRTGAADRERDRVRASAWIIYAEFCPIWLAIAIPDSTTEYISSRWPQVPLTTGIQLEAKTQSAPLELLDLDAALEAPREGRSFAELIEMRYFGGMTAEETAEALGQSVHIVRHDLRLAHAWLFRRPTSVTFCGKPCTIIGPRWYAHGLSGACSVS